MVSLRRRAEIHKNRRKERGTVKKGRGEKWRKSPGDLYTQTEYSDNAGENQVRRGLLGTPQNPHDWRI
jgi:hypothetical protein